MDILSAIVIGTLFGFVLQRVGAADPEKIIGMLTLRDLHLARAILTGIGVSSVILFAGLMFGLIDPSQLSIKAMNSGVIIGGMLLGFGWALGGFCPGTGLVGAGAGRKDALFFIAGGLIGAWVYTLTYQIFKDQGLLGDLLGGKVTLALTGKTAAIVDVAWSPYMAMAIGVAMIIAAMLLPEKLR